MICPVIYEDVSPNALRSNVTRGCMVLHREPQKTNLGHQPLTEGWLGTTNDISATALGEFNDNDIAGVVLAVTQNGYCTDAETIRRWVQSRDPELVIRRHRPDVHEGAAYKFVVTYNDEGEWEIDWDQYVVKKGYCEVDVETSGGAGNEPRHHDPETWERAFDRASIWYEHLIWHAEDAGGSSDVWFLYVREADRQRAIEAVEAEEVREEAGDAI